jgi:signal transduction histidine kinase
MASTSSLELWAAPPVSSTEIEADPARLRQVFSNLVGNAIKFTPPGGRIEIGCTPRRGEMCFWVSDTGPGMTPEQVAHLFDRFWQAHPARRGLGLTIAKAIVEAHGGRIRVDSAPGAGTTVHFSIPVAFRSKRPRRGTPHANRRVGLLGRA